MCLQIQSRNLLTIPCLKWITLPYIFEASDKNEPVFMSVMAIISKNEPQRPNNLLFNENIMYAF